MPAAIEESPDVNIVNPTNQKKMSSGVEKKHRDLQIPACFRNLSQEEPKKTFPHTKQVGDYLVGKVINKGSFAKVMGGLHILTGEKVAIKVIDKKKAKQDSYVLKNMKRESRIHQMIMHPNIVQLYETLETENSYYMVMELCLGGDLMDRICEKKRLDEEEAKEYTRHIMAAVDHLHHHGIVHRDLKIENFLLDENNSIQIVDFGLSNIIKFQGLSQELLNTQCGSPAYAAPELLAHKQYGPKVDVWSIGISTFAMLTGTLPFTVEPFNIKQLHLKMINGEMNAISPNISSGAVRFMHSLLEPDPTKRPTVKEAMQDKWLDYNISKSPNAFIYRNRLRPNELNPVVLSYMTEIMEFKLSDVVTVLIKNKPSSIMATYYLLLKKLIRYQREPRTEKKDHEPEKLHGEHSGSISQDADVPVLQKTKMAIVEKWKSGNNKAFHSTLSSKMPYVTKEDDIAVILENQEILPEASKFSGRELICFDLPKSPRNSCGPFNETQLEPQENEEDVKDWPEVRKLYLLEKPSSVLRNNPRYAMNHETEKSSVSYICRLTPRSRNENRIVDQDPTVFPNTKVKDLLKAMNENLLAPKWQHQERKSSAFLVMETPQLSPLPQLKPGAAKDHIIKKISWLGSSQQESIGSRFFVSVSRPPVFPVAHEHTFTVRSLRQSKQKSNDFFKNDKIKRNVPLKYTTKDADLNLPTLSPPYQTSGKKSEILRLDFA
ncbi:sucrose non-fermenting protein kinase 1-like [Pseudonaja textilis]|uniref:sucrose non-fermenting protein kinase 1-like n=1 Tax=Pseudonaja textilis TaxID=8673 RepID=UPI000EA8A0E4|nr:sucrose non-fermenting protein kinase 1-like [Pseudonaja textilis]